MPSNKKSNSSKQNNSTRLPPKSQQQKKTQAGGKPAKVNIKKILMDEREDHERLKDNLQSSTECLVNLLLSGQVPKAQTSDIQKQLLAVFGSDDDESALSLVEKLERVIILLSDATKVIETSWSYCLCFPSMDVASIAKVLDELQTVLCESASLANKPLQRKLASLQADAKADEKMLLELEDISKRMNGKNVAVQFSCLVS
jgi:hypothetical protein